MRLFNNATKSYKTPENAETKLRAVLGSDIDNYVWMIAIREDGRYVPVVTRRIDGEPHIHLIHKGICVI